MGVGRRMEWAQPRIHSERVPEEVAVEGQGEILPSGQGRRGGLKAIPYLWVCTWDHVWWPLQPCTLSSVESSLQHLPRLKSRKLFCKESKHTVWESWSSSYAFWWPTVNISPFWHLGGGPPVGSQHTGLKNQAHQSHNPPLPTRPHSQNLLLVRVLREN